MQSKEEKYLIVQVLSLRDKFQSSNVGRACEVS